MDIGSISAAISTFKATFDLVSTAIEARDQAKLNDLKITLTAQLLDISNTALALQEKLATQSKEQTKLEEQIRALTQQLEDLDRYKPHHFETGTVAFVDSRLQGGEPQTYFCAACMTEHKKTILQPARNGIFLDCPLGHPPIAFSNTSRTIMSC